MARILTQRKTAKKRNVTRHAINAERVKLHVTKGDTVRVLRGDQTLRTRVSTRTLIADSPVESGDQLYVPDRGWATRNIAVISAAVSAVGIIVFAVGLTVQRREHARVSAVS